jgi:hypothetical protein
VPTIDHTGETSRVITDVTGRFNRVVMETEAEILAEYEERMKE